MLNSLPERLRLAYARAISSGAPLLLLLGGLYWQTRFAWLLSLGLLALVSLLAWLSHLYRYRSLRNTPTSSIAGAAQGQVELAGKGESFCEPPIYSQFKRRPCLWCRYLVEEQQKSEWHTVERGETTHSFVLRDRTGICLVDPEWAEIVTLHHEEWTDGGQRFTEWLLLPGDSLRVVGAFRTLNGRTEVFDTRQELNAQLAEWKQDMPRLLARFDADRDGTFSPAEWEQVRRAAMQEVVQRKNEWQMQPETHVLSRPQDGQFFLISNMPEDKLQRRFLILGWLHLVVFLAAMGGIGWAWRQFPASH